MDTPHAPRALMAKEKGKKSLKTLMIIGVVILFFGILALVFIYFSGITSKSNLPDYNKPVDITSPDYKMKGEIEITKPMELFQIDGIIEIQGAAKRDITELLIEVFDDKNNKLGDSKVTEFVSTLQDPPPEFTGWSTTLDLINSPLTKKGRIIATSINPNVGWKHEIKIEFSDQEFPERLKIYGPISNQSITGQEILISGEMKGFPEGVLNVRFKNDSGDTIFTDTVEIQGDNSTIFRYFTKDISFPNAVNFNTKNILIEFYEVSQADGTDNVLIVLNLRNQIPTYSEQNQE